EVNRRFQELVVAQYPSWLAADGEVRLTSQFLRRCVKPHWDPQREKAVIFIFDGMRYDVWDEMLRPMLLDRLEVIDTGADLNAYAKVETQGGCCSPSPSSLPVAEKGCCSAAPADEGLHRRLADLLRRYNVNDYAASVRVYAVKP